MCLFYFQFLFISYFRIRELEDYAKDVTQLHIQIQGLNKHVSSQRDELLVKQNDIRELKEEIGRLSERLVLKYTYFAVK